MAKIPRLKPIEGSSNIDAEGYSRATRTMAVRFKTGAVYLLQGVPPEVHTAFMAAESRGKYYYKHIRDAYEYTKVEEAK